MAMGDDDFSDVIKGKQAGKPAWKWTAGPVDTDKDHIKLWHGKRVHQDSKGRIYQYAKAPAARVMRGPGKSFIVQFLLSTRSTNKRTVRILKDVRRELDFYLLEVGGRNPWAYARYHCGTMANWYSKVHWQWRPKKSKERPPRQR